MKHLYLLLLFTIVASLTLIGCVEEKKRPSGNPSEVLDLETNNKLQQQYSTIKNFQKGTAVVKKNKFGLIDEFGKEILPCEYDSIYDLYKHFRIIKKNELFGATNDDGVIIKECTYSMAIKGDKSNYIAFKSNDKWGIADFNGKDITQYKYEDISTYDDSVFVAKYNGFYGVSDYEGNILIPYKYDKIYPKWTFYYPATIVVSGKYYGMYNSKYEQVLECEYKLFFPDKSGYVAVEKNSRRGLIEQETGKVIFPFEFKSIGNYREGLVCCENENGKYGYLDLEGNVVIPFIYEKGGDFSEGLAAVYKQSGYFNSVFGRLPKYKCGYIDNKGNVVIPFIFQETLSINDAAFHEGLAAQGKDNSNNKFSGTLGYIDKTGNWVISPKYNRAEGFENGVASMAIDDRYGYINKLGEEIIPCIYDKYGGMLVNDSTIQVEKDGVEFYFNLQGQSVAKPVDY